MNIGIIDLGINNIKSVKDFFSLFGKTYILNNDNDLKPNTKLVILPGNGSFNSGIESLKKNKLDILLSKIYKDGVLLIGICLGMQILFENSEENFGTKGLNFFEGSVKKIKSSNCRLPLLGWYQVKSSFNELNNKTFFFNNGFSCFPKKDIYIKSSLNLGDYKVIASIKKENLIGLQFHPEKSSSNGLHLIKSLLEKANV
tara:strand:+ start:633 stop:1232 length:600 start_codon:yes stop_codon:yes gene_type:complete